MIKYFLFLLLPLLFSLSVSAKDKSLIKAAKVYLQKIHKPQSTKPFPHIPHLPPFNQDTTNACWSFSTLSFIEAEMLRLGLPAVRLSPMFSVYHAFLEKARYFVKREGQAHFGPGDLFSGVLETIKKYGIVPQQVYKGQTRSCKTYNHTELERELLSYIHKIFPNQLFFHH